MLWTGKMQLSDLGQEDQQASLSVQAFGQEALDVV
jgi:hypothetical protein